MKHPCGTFHCAAVPSWRHVVAMLVIVGCASLLGTGAGPSESSRPTTKDARRYQDPKGRFQLEVPLDWEVVLTMGRDGVVFQSQKIAATLAVDLVGTPRSAKAMAEEAVKRGTREWKGYSETKREEGKLAGAGQPSLTLECAGELPQTAGAPAVKARMRVLASVLGDQGILICLVGSEEAFTAAQSAWDRVVRTITVGEGTLAREKGKTYRHAIGFSFWYPADWTVKEQSDFLQLLPPDPGSTPEGPTELYFLVGESVSAEGITRADDPRVIQYLESQVRSVAPSLQRIEGSTPAGMARGQGTTLQWEAKSPKGDTVRATAHATAHVSIIQGYGVALLAIGLKERLEARGAKLRQIFASFDFGSSEKDPQIVGTWQYEKNFWAGTYSSTTVRTLVLKADGSFTMTGQFAASLDSKDSGGNDTGRVSGNSDRGADKGRWGAAGSRLYLFYDDGSYSEYKYYVEKQSDGKAMLLETGGKDKQLWTAK
jgi:hypothetical protein